MGTGNQSAGGHARWEGVSDEERHVALQHVRDGMLTRARAEAYAQAETLGVTLTEEQADNAARRILHDRRTARVIAARRAAIARKAAAK